MPPRTAPLVPHSSSSNTPAATQCQNVNTYFTLNFNLTVWETRSAHPTR